MRLLIDPDTGIRAQATFNEWARRLVTAGEWVWLRDWYGERYSALLDVMQAKRPDLTRAQCSTIVAILSPNSTWKANQTMALRLLDGDYADSGYKFQAAIDVMNDPDHYPSLDTPYLGQKTLPFALAGLGDTSQVVVDLWMMRAARWKDGQTHDQPTTGQYRVIESVVRKLAHRLDKDPAAVQAAVWVLERGSAE